MNILNQMLTTYSTRANQERVKRKNLERGDIPCAHDLRLCGTLGQKWRGYLLRCMSKRIYHKGRAAQTELCRRSLVG
jgi:hypothetical protein